VAFYSNRTKLRHDALPAVEAWVEEINRRRDEFEQTFADEGMKFEAWILEEAEDGLYLVSLMETDDIDKVYEVYAKSRHPIDAYHREFLEKNKVGFKANRVVFAGRPPK